MFILSLLLSASIAQAIVPHLLSMQSQQMIGRRFRTPEEGVVLAPDQYFNQTLDHQNALNIGFWPQRFWVNTTFWSGPANNAPVFLYVEGEGAGSAYDVFEGQHVELAAQHNALVIALEHRFFGASVPTPTLSLENMATLSSHQAIGDLARFIQEYIVPTYNVVLPTGNPIVSFGGSYPGALSAWARLRLPHLIGFAFSTSSPVEAQLDFEGYCQVVNASMSNPAVGGSDACLTQLTSAFTSIDQALRGTPAEQAAMAARLYSCAAPQSLDDIKLLASNAASVIMGIVQYNNEGGGPNIDSVCTNFTTPGNDPVDTFAAALLQTLPPGQTCMDNSYSDFITQQVGNVTVNLGAQGVGIRQWTYMTCVAFSYFQTCETDCPFSSLMDLPSQIKICQDAFSPFMDGSFIGDRVNFTNDFLGGQNIDQTSILFVNGGIDPWHFLSVRPDNLKKLYGDYAVWIPTGAHCRAMLPSSPNDPSDVVTARLESATILAAFLQGTLAGMNTQQSVVDALI